MRKAELVEAIHQVIQLAVQRSGGQWKASYIRDVEHIFELFGKLSPEPNSGNIKPPPPVYNKKQVHKVGPRKVKFKPEQRNAARALLRKMGMI